MSPEEESTPHFPELTRRQREILALIIRTYTENPEPVSSRTLVDSHGMDISTATVRNEMAHLEEMGYITAPHTSAGRIPTTQGYRYFVSELLQGAELPQAEQRHIEARFHELPGMMEAWYRQAATTLARTANTASLVTSPTSGHNRFKHIELISIQGRLALMVMVLQGGVVHQRMLNLAEPVSQTILSETADRLNSLCDNLNTSEMRIKSHNASALEREVIEIATDLMSRSTTSPSVILYRDGLSEIISTFPDSEGAQQAVRIFEERAFLDMILTDILQPARQHGEVRVVIAGEGRWEELNQVSLVLSHYGVHGQLSGALGILGPTSLDYGRAISAVKHMSGIMTDMLVRLYEDRTPESPSAPESPSEDA